MSDAPTPDRAHLQAMLNACPFHRFLRPELVDFSAGEGWIAIAVAAREALSRSDQRVELHGGVIAALIDIAGDYAVALKLGRGVPTIGLHVDYLRFARGARAMATGRIVKLGRSIAVVDIMVTDETGALIAVGRGSYSSVRPRPADRKREGN